MLVSLGHRLRDGQRDPGGRDTPLFHVKPGKGGNPVEFEQSVIYHEAAKNGSSKTVTTRVGILTN